MPVPCRSPARGDFPQPLPLRWLHGGSPGAALLPPVSHAGLGITSWEKSSPLQPADPAEDYPEGVAGRRGEQSHCLEGTALFEMLFKALDDSQQQLEGISSW